MRILWTLLKVIVALMVAIPLAVVALGLTVGIVGAFVGLAIVALKLAFFALLAFGAFRLARRLFGSKPERQPPVVRELAEPTDRYYAAAMRELDVELGRTPRS